WGDLVMNPEVTMNSNIGLQFVGPISTTITTNGSALGNFDFTIRKASESATITVLDDMVNTLTRIELFRGGLNLSNKNVNIDAISDISTTLPTRIDISNAVLNVNWAYTGSQKSLTATGSEITASVFHANGGVYNKVDIQAVDANRISVVNSTFSQLEYSNPSTSSAAHISGG